MKSYYLLFGLVLVLVCALRIYNLGSNPPAPYWEEVALGYDAYSILKTGKDHHGNSFPLVAFESFGDWKPSLYFYTIIPFIVLFDLSVISVRLPAALAGIATIFATASIVLLLFKKFYPSQKNNYFYIYIFALFIAGISPWGIIFSRAGWEAMLATALVSWGVFFGIKLYESNDRQRVYLFFTAFFLLLSLYAYHATRIISPLLGLFFTGIFLQKNSRNSFKNLFFQSFPTIVVSLLLLIPLVSQLGNNEIQHRFTETSIFTDIRIIEESNELKNLAGNTVVSKLLYHRYLLFGREVLSNFLSHFTIGYLFVFGDENPRHSIQYLGQLYPIEIIGLIMGIFFFMKKKSVYTFFLFFWIVIGVLPASITFASPHALRTLATFPAFMILIIFGWIYSVNLLVDSFLKYGKNGRFFVPFAYTSLLLIYIFQLTVFWRFYTHIYPLEHSAQWQYGYQQLYEKVTQLRRHNEGIPTYVTRSLGRPAMYYWFYQKENPIDVQSMNKVIQKDQSEYLSYKNLYFNTSFTKETKAIVALTKKEYDEYISNGNTLQSLEIIVDKRDQPIAYVGIYETK